MKFIAGLDLGQSNDYTALSILERIELPKKDDKGEAIKDKLGQPVVERAYHCRHLQRFQLNTRYPAIVQAVEAIIAKKPLADNSVLVVDNTGVGRPVCDMFSATNASFVPITITGGMVTNANPQGGYNVCKHDLVSVVQALLHSGRLKFAKALPEAETLQKELLNFQIKVTDSANATFGAWREGMHDDLVLSVALAAWYGDQLGSQIWI